MRRVGVTEERLLQREKKRRNTGIIKMVTTAEKHGETKR
jgi:hypothetical protein